jgi:hypothetical protein
MAKHILGRDNCMTKHISGRVNRLNKTDTYLFTLSGGAIMLTTLTAFKRIIRRGL